MAGLARDPRINLALLAQAQETSRWCTKGNTDPADLVVMIIFIMIGHA